MDGQASRGSFCLSALVSCVAVVLFGRVHSALSVCSSFGVAVCVKDGRLRKCSETMVPTWTGARVHLQTKTQSARVHTDKKVPEEAHLCDGFDRVMSSLPRAWSLEADRPTLRSGLTRVRTTPATVWVNGTLLRQAVSGLATAKL